MPHKCLACGRRITWTFAICAKCEGTYGNKSREWPGWLSFLWKSEQRNRRRNKRERDHEIVMTDLALEYGDEVDGYIF